MLIIRIINVVSSILTYVAMKRVIFATPLIIMNHSVNAQFFASSNEWNKYHDGIASFATFYRLQFAANLGNLDM
jgi:hypothetical protein